MKAVFFLLIFAVALDYSEEESDLARRNLTINGPYNATWPDEHETIIVVEISGYPNCTESEFGAWDQNCRTLFIHEMQKNPKSNCSAEYENLVDCLVKTEKDCDDKVDEAFLKKVYISDINLQMRNMTCNKAYLHIDAWPGDYKYLYEGFSCKKGQEEQIRLKKNRCADKAVEMWQANRADERLCSEYMNIKSCNRKLIEDASCNKTKRDEMVINMTLGNYNPFCPNGIDPAISVSSIMTCPFYGVLFLFICAFLMEILKFYDE